MADPVSDGTTKSPKKKKKQKIDKPHARWDRDEEELLLGWLERPEREDQKLERHQRQDIEPAKQLENANDFLAGTGNRVDGEGGLDRDGELKAEKPTEPQPTAEETEEITFLSHAVADTATQDEEEQQSGQNNSQDDQVTASPKANDNNEKSSGDNGEDKNRDNSSEWTDETTPIKTEKSKTAIKFVSPSAAKPSWKKSPKKPSRVADVEERNAVKILLSLEEGKDKRFEKTRKLAERRLELRYEETLTVRRREAKNERHRREERNQNVEKPAHYNPEILD